MRHSLGEGERLAAPRPGLLGIAEEPQGPGETRQARDAGSRATAEREHAGLLGIIKSHPLLEGGPSGDVFS